MSRVTSFLAVLILAIPSFAQNVSFYQTTPDLSQKLQQKTALTFGTSGTASQTVTVDETKTYQQVEGFGASITDSAAWLIGTKLTQSQRDATMQSLFSKTNGIGLTFLRQPMGASDLAVDFYTYDDMPAGQTDATLSHFSIDHDKAYIIPVLKQALAINPKIKMMANPWSAPAWMKTNNSLMGSPNGNNGYLKSDAYGPYANYFVKFIQAYQAEGVKTDYISMINEPLYAPPGYTGMLMQTTDQINLLNNNLAPALSAAGLKTKVMLYDHNWDRDDFALTVLNNASVRANAAGVAWHHYAGNPSTMTKIHDLYPQMDAWVTEASGGDWQSGNVLVEEGKELVNVMRNWSRAYVLWSMAQDQNRGPYAIATDGKHGCDTCRGIIKVTWDKTNSGAPSVVTNELDYYVLGHASKFLQEGAYRIASDGDTSNGPYNVAFRNPDGSVVLYVVNANSGADSTFNVKFHGQYFTTTVTAGSIATFVWTPTQTPAVSLTHEPNGLSIAGGQSGSVGLSVQPVNGAAPSVTLSCAVADSTGTSTTKASCAVSPTNLSFTDANPQNATVNVTTVKSSSQQRSPFNRTAFFAVFAIGIVAFGGVRKRKLALFGVALVLLVGFIACGGGGGGSSTYTPPPTGGGTVTTSTMYFATVTATTNSGAQVNLSIPVLVN